MHGSKESARLYEETEAQGPKSLLVHTGNFSKESTLSPALDFRQHFLPAEGIVCCLDKTRLEGLRGNPASRSPPARRRCSEGFVRVTLQPAGQRDPTAWLGGLGWEPTQKMSAHSALFPVVSIAAPSVSRACSSAQTCLQTRVFLCFSAHARVGARAGSLCAELCDPARSPRCRRKAGLCAGSHTQK